MFKNTTIGARLWFLTIVTNLLLLIVGAVGWLGMSRSNEATHQIYGQQLSAAVNLAEARSNQLLVRVLLDQATFATDPADAKARATAEGFARDSEKAWKPISPCRARLTKPGRWRMSPPSAMRSSSRASRR